jgi:hypothetical protein
MKRGTKAVVGAGAGLAVAGGALAFLLLRPGPVLLAPEDFPGVVSAHQNGRSAPPGWTNCDLSISGWVRPGGPDTELIFGPGQRAGAAIGVEPSPLSGGSAGEIAYLERTADTCADSEKTEHGFSIEPLPGLDDGAVGWRTKEEGYVRGGQEGYLWGEYVVIPLDEHRLLAVGFQTDQEEPPVDMDRLVELAKQGAEQFPATG